MLLLRDVLDFSAAEVATQLGTTVAATNSALQRARAAVSEVGDVGEIAEPDDPEVRTVIERYVRAFEAADVPALVRLLTDDAVLEMPPVPLWYRGSTAYGRFMDRVFQMRGTGWVMTELTANGQPALAAYAPQPSGGHTLHTLQVLAVADRLVTQTSCSPTRARSRRSTCRPRFLPRIFAGRDEFGRCHRYVPASTDRRGVHRERHLHSVHHP